ncbi:SLC13 family permease [Winogradskyella psychrotolerans]|uniref:SLC13 family permease n=1 Tax=Winogradskyella psychrotolerans TaxID=1344585 RepID=UPI001C07DA93|nr:sodium:proton antiporter [Winogradskyella psychrotolerans]MBU2928295.1 sodium:proton antiporter [Winogradskyella psychrotolerans]
MALSIILVFIIVGISILLFVTELFPVDKISFFIIVALVLLQLTTPEEAISGFANPATITVLALMILAVGLEENGVIQLLSDGIKKLKTVPLILLTPAFMFISASISAFISTTAVVIIFIKIITRLSEKYGFSSSRLLMPISFAGILGGSCTLMGTSTNLIVNAIAKKHGIEVFSFFEFTWYGIIFFLIGLVIMTLASRFLPKTIRRNLSSDYDIDSYVFTVKVTEDSPLIGKRFGDIEFMNQEDSKLLKLIRNNQVINDPGKYIKLMANDNLVLMSDLDNFQAFMKENGFVLNEKRQKQQLDNYNKDEENDLTYIETLILPGSNLIGKTLKGLRRMSFEGAFPIAIKKRRNLRNTRERLLRKNIDDINLKPGDRVLLEMQEHKISDLYHIENIAILNEHEFKPNVSKSKRMMAILILLGVISLAATSVLSILTASLVGVSVMLLTNIIRLESVYQKVNWQIVFLLAGMIPLGIAMTNSGADLWISTHLLNIMSDQDPTIVLGLLFGITIILSGVISNNATAIIMAPIAIAVASGLSLDIKPFLLAVMFGSNFSFFTPVGYQTNTLIYGTGVYKFKHFLIIGGVLSLTLWIVGTLLLSSSL